MKFIYLFIYFSDMYDTDRYSRHYMDSHNESEPNKPQNVNVINLQNINDFNLPSIIKSEVEFEDVGHAQNILQLDVSMYKNIVLIFPTYYIFFYYIF